mmetsp:Transcript_19859/g.36856  ORF Transcript_19859/g.36856 Transcript_19859/m.36856 type:complete len:387 (-) Transcript_19859:39-1199(-)
MRKPGKKHRKAPQKQKSKASPAGFFSAGRRAVSVPGAVAAVNAAPTPAVTKNAKSPKQKQAASSKGKDGKHPSAKARKKSPVQTSSSSSEIVVVGQVELDAFVAQGSLSNPNPADAGAYRSSQRILLVGEGSFSFARALSTKIGGKNIVASSLDSRKVVLEKYDDVGEGALIDLRNSGAKVYHDIDATNKDHLETCLGQWEYFDVVVFNFPHLGGGTQEALAANQELVSNFFAAAQTVLRQEPDIDSESENESDEENLGNKTGAKKRKRSAPSYTPGEIHVTLRSTLFYDSWNIPLLAEAQGLRLKSKDKFDKDDFPGYEDVRTNPAARDAPGAENAHTYKFVIEHDDARREEAERDAADMQAIPRKKRKSHRRRRALMLMQKNRR